MNLFIALLLLLSVYSLHKDYGMCKIIRVTVDRASTSDENTNRGTESIVAPSMEDADFGTLSSPSPRVPNLDSGTTETASLEETEWYTGTSSYSSPRVPDWVSGSTEAGSLEVTEWNTGTPNSLSPPVPEWGLGTTETLLSEETEWDNGTQAAPSSQDPGIGLTTTPPMEYTEPDIPTLTRDDTLTPINDDLDNTTDTAGRKADATQLASSFTFWKCQQSNEIQEDQILSNTTCDFSTWFYEKQWDILGIEWVLGKVGIPSVGAEVLAAVSVITYIIAINLLVTIVYGFFRAMILFFYGMVSGYKTLRRTLEYGRRSDNFEMK